MARTPGSRNADYDAKRNALADAAWPRLVADRGATSFNELAVAADVAVPTLRHYFADRAGFVAFAVRRQKEGAAEHTEPIAQPSSRSLRKSLLDVATNLAEAWVPWGVGHVFAAGLAAGVSDRAVGRATVDGILEPTVQALERRLRAHAQRGEIDLAVDDSESTRVAALAFLSPLLIALLHQHDLDGAACRPLDLGRFARTHVDRFVSAWSPKEGSTSATRQR